MAGNDLRAFRWGMATFHPDVTYLHHAHSFAKEIGESGRIIESYKWRILIANATAVNLFEILLVEFVRG